MMSPLEFDIIRNQARLDLAEAELSHWQSRVNTLRRQIENQSQMLLDQAERSNAQGR